MSVQKSEKDRAAAKAAPLDKQYRPIGSAAIVAALMFKPKKVLQVSVAKAA